MRIAFFQRDLPPAKFGGVAGQVHDLAEALVAVGEEVTVFSLSPAPPGAHYRVEQVALPERVKRSRFLRRYLLGYYFSRVNVKGFDVVHTHGDNWLMFGKTPQVRTYYGSALAEALHARRPSHFFAQLLSWGLELAGLLSPDLRAAISPGTRRYLPAIDTVVPCGADLRCFSPGAARSAAPSILFVGALKGRKRGDLMLRIFRKVRSRIPNAELWTVMPEKIKGEGVKSYSGIGGEELARLYRSAWVLCMTSSYEGFGVPLVEAMASGTPVIAAPTDGSRYVLEDGRHGLLVPPEGMADTLCGILGSPEKRASFAAKGLKRAAEFDILKTAEAYRTLYHAVIDKKRQ